jgi:hypothetical protein
MMGATMNTVGMVSMVTPNEPQALQTLLQTQFSDTGITVVDHATGGTASSLMNLLAGTDGGGPPFTQRIATSPAVIVLDNHGVNDALGGEVLSDYQGYLSQWISDVRAAGKTPVLEEPGPVCDGNHPFLDQYVAAMDTAAALYNVPLVQQYSYIQSIDGWCSHMVNGFYPDSYIDSLKAAQEDNVIAPLVRAIIGSQS